MSKVLLLTTSLSGGGAERNVALLSRRLSAEITVGIFTEKPNPFPHGGEILNLDFRPTRGLIGKLRQWLRVRKVIAEFKRQHEVRATISFLDPPNLLNLITPGPGRRIVSVRNFKALQDQSGGGGLPQFGDWLLRRWYNRADAVVAVSRALRDDLQQRYKIRPGKLRVIYNACDSETVEAQAQEAVPAHFEPIFNASTIITAGRLEQQKGHWHLIRAFSLVKQTVADARLVILGQGQLANYLIDLTKGLGLSVYTASMAKSGQAPANEDVYLLGYQTNPYALLKRSSLFALPSLYEGFPNVVLEAMACGLPVVASDCLSGPREILAPDMPLDQKLSWPYQAPYGVLLPVCDGVRYGGDAELMQEERHWAEGLTTLLTTPAAQERYRSQSPVRIRDLTVENIVNQWETLIRKQD